MPRMRGREGSFAGTEEQARSAIHTTRICFMASSPFERRKTVGHCECWSWRWVWRFVGMAAGLLCGFEFHEFDAGSVGIVDVEGPFAVPAVFCLEFGDPHRDKHSFPTRRSSD